MKKYSIVLALGAFLFTACNNEEATLDVLGMFSSQGPTVNTRFEQSLAYNDSVGEMHFDMGQDVYDVYVCADSHITRKAHKNMDCFMDIYQQASSPKLAIHLGDLIDAQKNFAFADSIVHFAGQTRNDTLLLALGNHDIYFNQWNLYRAIFRTSAYWFDTRNGSKKLDLFICLDSAEGELGTKQTAWLKQLLAAKSKEGYRRIIVFTHTHLWKLDSSQGHTSNYALEATYELTSLLGQYGVYSVWSGHQHARQLVTYKGVEYRVLNATKDSEYGQSYMIATMGEGVNYRYFDYPKQ